MNGGIAPANICQKFIYDEFLCISRRDETDLPMNVGIDVFSWDPTEAMATRPLMCNSAKIGPFVYCNDGNKNITDAIALDGSWTVHYEYSPFGGAQISVDASHDMQMEVNPFRFSSEYVDDTLGLVYYNYRHYNPLCGRWISADPAEDAMESPESPYAFCNNKLAFDVLGLMPSLGELLIISGALEKMSRSPVARYTGYGSVLTQGAMCLGGLASAVGDPPECVATDDELSQYNSECISGARNAISGCMGNLAAAVSAIAASGGGFMASLIASQIGKILGNAVGGYAAGFISSEWLQDTFCGDQPKVDPCCGK